jgi:hypothetical protein
MPTYVNTLCRFSAICGALPLLMGLILFVGIRVTDAGWLLPAAAFYFLFLVACWVLGAGALIWSLVANRRIRALLPGRIWGSAWLAALLLFSNLLVAALWVFGDEIFTPEFSIVVLNDSPSPLESASIGGPCCHTLLGDIPPHEERTASFRIDNDGSFSLHYKQGTRDHTEIIGYLGINQRGNQLVIVNPGGLANVR